MGNCPGGELSRWGSVLVRSGPSGNLSRWGVVPSGDLFWWGAWPSGELSSGELSWWGLGLVVAYLVESCPGAEWGIVLVGSCLVGGSWWGLICVGVV